MRRGLSLGLTSVLLLVRRNGQRARLAGRTCISATDRTQPSRRRGFSPTRTRPGASAPRLAKGGGNALAAAKCDDSTPVPASKADSISW